MSGNKGKISTKKVLIALLSIVMVAGFIVLFVAASRGKQEGSCKGIVISFDKKERIMYVDTASIRKQLDTNKQLNPVGKTLNRLNLPLLKQSVGAHDWVKSAEVYMGNHDLLHIKITQRVPVARVFRDDGFSFYLDRAGGTTPALGKFTIRLPVFTGFPKRGKKAAAEDSSLLVQIGKISHFIARDSFWMAQVEQINMNSENEFELVPKVGDALILFGEGAHIKEKFDKLLTFYKKGLNNVGWGYYDTLDLRFVGQVVASRKGTEENPAIVALKEHNAPKVLINEKK